MLYDASKWTYKKCKLSSGAPCKSCSTVRIPGKTLSCQSLRGLRSLNYNSPAWTTQYYKGSNTSRSALFLFLASSNSSSISMFAGEVDLTQCTKEDYVFFDYFSLLHILNLEDFYYIII